MTAQGTDIDIQCDRGTFRATLRDASPRSGMHVVCYCADCQAFAALVDREQEMLDEHGGTAIFQTSPSALRIDAGADQLACTSLTGKGALRWHTRCCNTPIGSTLPSPTMSFVSLVRSSLSLEGTAGADTVLGPIKARVFAQHASQADAAFRPQPPSAAFYFRLIRLLLGSRLSGRYRQTPFFTFPEGKPVAEPHYMSESERAQYYQ
jgi:hypothetical protein